MAPRSKYRAVRQFMVGAEAFDEGDEVPPGIALNVALTHGDTFVKLDTARTRKQADDASTSPED